MTQQYYEAYVELIGQLCSREDYADKQKVRRHNAAMKKLQALQMKMCEDMENASDAKISRKFAKIVDFLFRR